MRELKFRLFGDGKMYQPFKFDNDFDCVSGWLSDRILLQYTGLKDKNGKEIYEGDIVRFHLENLETLSGVTHTIYIEEVIYIDGCFCVDGHVPLSAAIDWDLEIIGNVHQNPELL